MIRPILLVLIFTSGVSASAQTGAQATKKQSAPVTSSTVVDDWQTGETLTPLIRVGFKNKIALGIVLEGNSLCRNSVPGSSGGIRIGSLIDQVQKQSPDYVIEIRDRMLYVHPKSMTGSTLNTLDLRIPRFSSPIASAQQIGITLWMFIRGVLVPKETSMFTGGLQRNAETLPAIALSNASVRDILDKAITSGQGGVWVMYKVPADWQSDPKTKPYEILSYSGDQSAAQFARCPDENQ
jgi:hypothetical protein